MNNQDLKGSLGQLLRKKTLYIDELSIFLAFISAVLIRYKAITRWVDFSIEIYFSLLLSAMVLQVIVFASYDMRRLTIAAMDPIDVLIKTIKSRLLLLGISVVFLYLTQRKILTSKTVMSLFFIFSVVYGYLLKMLYRRIFLKNHRIPGDLSIYVIEPPYGPVKKDIEKIKNENYDCAIIITDGQNNDTVMDIVKELEKNNIRAYQSVESTGYKIRSGMTTDLGGYAVISSYLRNERFTLFGVNFCIARAQEAVYHVIRHIKSLKGRYICFSNVHTVVTAREDKSYAEVLNGAAMTFADGAPIAHLEKKHGLEGVERVAGPDFMQNMFENTADGSLSHYFYGSKPETLKALSENLKFKYPNLDVRGYYSPPFRDITPEEDAEDIKRINDSGADIIWIGLGAPKQEKWMRAHEGKLCGVMMGVGAGFDFHAGATKRAPEWIQKNGLEWLYRLFSDPGRLFKRYFNTNIKFFWYLFIDKLKK